MNRNFDALELSAAFGTNVIYESKLSFYRNGSELSHLQPPVHSGSNFTINQLNPFSGGW